MRINYEDFIKFGSQLSMLTDPDSFNKKVHKQMLILYFWGEGGSGVNEKLANDFSDPKNQLMLVLK